MEARELINCTGCSTSKTADQFYSNKARKSGRSDYCKTCCSEQARIFHKKHPEKNQQQNIKRRKRIREALLNGYGNRCSCCGEDEPVFLTLEHLDGTGAAHRKTRSPDGIYLDVIRSNFPDTFTILCMNCNFAKRFNKECPHKKKA